MQPNPEGFSFPAHTGALIHDSFDSAKQQMHNEFAERTEDGIKLTKTKLETALHLGLWIAGGVCVGVIASRLINRVLGI